MAYQIKGGVIINDSRELIGVNTAGINTSLFVGDQIQLDGGSGIVTAVSFIGDGSQLTGIITSGGGGQIDGELIVTGIASLGGGLVVTGVSTFNSDIDLNSNDILNGGTGNFADLVVSGTTTLGTALSFTGGDSDEFLSGITTDLNESAGATEVITAEGVKNYVDGQVGSNNQLNFVGDTGQTGEIDLATETFDISGTANQIDSDVAVALGQTVSLSLSSTLVLPGSLAFNGGDPDENFTGITTDLDESSLATEAVTAQAVKNYVDGQVAGNTELTIQGDNVGGIGTINLGTETFVINGTSNEIVTQVTGDPGVLAIGLAAERKNSYITWIRKW